MIPKYQNLTLPNDNTRVVRQPIYHKIKYTPKPGEFIWTNRDGTKSIVRGKNAQLSQDNRSSKQRKQDQKSAVAIRKQRELKAAEQQTTQVAGEVLNRAMPSTIVRAIHDAAKGKNSFVGSMIEGNKGLGDPALNFAFDIAAPIGVAKGFKYATDIVPKVARFGVSNHTGNWTQFGNNNMYRLKPGYIGMNSIQMERKAIITPEDLVNRKFFSVEEYGRKPIYTRQEANEMIKNKQLRYAKDELNPDINSDITYIEENVGDGPMESPVQIAAKRLRQWKKSPHGRIMETTKDSDYSTKSWEDGFRFALNRHLAGEGTMYPVSRPLMHGTDIQEGVMKPGYILINREADKINLLPTQELADRWNLLIKQANEQTGLNFPEAIFEPRTPTIINGQIVGYSNRPRLFGPAFGLLKQEKGGKIYARTVTN